MDSFFAKSAKVVTIRQLHLLGVTSIFIASKIEDLIPFRLKTIYNKIGHQALSKEAILLNEKEVLETLDFNVKLPTVHEYSNMFLVELFKGTKHEHYRLATHIIDYISKMAQHDYGFSLMTQNNLSAAVLYLTFVVMEKLVNKTCLTKEFMKKLTKFTKVSEKCILENSKCLLRLIRNFDSIYPGLTNMKDVQFKFLSKYL